MTEPSQCVAVLGVWPYLLKASKGRAVGIVERQGWIGGIRVDNLFDLNSNTSVVVMSTRGDYDLWQSWSGEGLAAELMWQTVSDSPTETRSL